MRNSILVLFILVLSGCASTPNYATEKEHQLMGGMYALTYSCHIDGRIDDAATGKLRYNIQKVQNKKVYDQNRVNHYADSLLKNEQLMGDCSPLFVFLEREEQRMARVRAANSEPVPSRSGQDHVFCSDVGGITVCN